MVAGSTPICGKPDLHEWKEVKDLEDWNSLQGPGCFRCAFLDSLTSWALSLVAHLALCADERSAWNWFLLVPGLHRRDAQVHWLESSCSSMLQTGPKSEPLRKQGPLYMQLCLHAVLVALLESWPSWIVPDSVSGVSSFNSAIYGSCFICGSTCTPETSPWMYTFRAAKDYYWCSLHKMLLTLFPLCMWKWHWHLLTPSQRYWKKTLSYCVLASILQVH